MPALSGKKFKVLVTGFGPFSDTAINPSWEIARQLPSALIGPNGEEIHVVVPKEYIPVAYHTVLAQVPKLIEEHAPDLVVHMGLDSGNDVGVFRVEKSAPREGYHETPDVDRKVFTKVENKTAFGKAPSTLITTLDLAGAADLWRNATSLLSLPKTRAPTGSTDQNKSKERQVVEVAPGDGVGTFVCGFIYYCGMLAMQKKTGKRNVVFIHVPSLEGVEEIQVGVQVTEAVIKALVGVFK